MPAKWPAEKERELRRLVASQRHTYHEIATLMGIGRNDVATKASALGLSNPVYLRRRTKHKHLRGALLEYYLTHSAKECQEHFGLTPSEFKSCLTVAYRDPKLAHIRKDTRRHDSWSVAESVELLRRSGVQPRLMIARHLSRGGVHAVKEQLYRLGTGSKALNGMPAKWVHAAFPLHCDRLPYVKTSAGPTGGTGFQFVIVPWVALRPLLRCRIDPLLKRYIRIMSSYQRWIFDGRSTASIVRSIGMYAKEKPCRLRSVSRRAPLRKPR